MAPLTFVHSLRAYSYSHRAFLVNLSNTAASSAARCSHRAPVWILHCAPLQRPLWAPNPSHIWQDTVWLAEWSQVQSTAHHSGEWCNGTAAARNAGTAHSCGPGTITFSMQTHSEMVWASIYQVCIFFSCIVLMYSASKI